MHTYRDSHSQRPTNTDLQITALGKRSLSVAVSNLVSKKSVQEKCIFFGSTGKLTLTP